MGGRGGRGRREGGVCGGRGVRPGGVGGIPTPSSDWGFCEGVFQLSVGAGVPPPVLTGGIPPRVGLGDWGFFYVWF